jgi:anti-sigma B factor antagonist
MSDVHVDERQFSGEISSDDPAAVVVVLRGELDTDSVAEARAVLDRATALAAGDVRLEVSALSFVSACGLGALAVLASRVADRGHRVHLCGAPPLLLRLLDITDLTRYFTIDQTS